MLWLFLFLAGQLVRSFVQAPILSSRSRSCRPAKSDPELQRQIGWGKEMRDASDAEEILELFMVHGHEFSSRNVATAAHRVAKRGGVTGEDPRVRRLAFACCARLKHCNAQELGNMAWAFARARVDMPYVYEALAREAQGRLSEFKAQNVANTAWAFAKVRVRAPALFEAIANETRSRTHEFRPQELTNMAWAFTTAGVKDARLFEAISKESKVQLPRFNSQCIAITAWSFAKAGFATTDFFQVLADQARKRLYAFKAQELSITVWAFATSNVTAPTLFSGIARHSQRKLELFSAQNLANTAWAFATARLDDPVLFEAIANETRSRVYELGPQELSAIAWAFATQGLATENFFEALAEASMPKMALFKAQSIGNMAWAFAQANVEAPQLFEALADQGLKQNMSDFSNIHNVAWAFAQSGVSNPDFFEALGNEAANRIKDFSPEAIGILAWAFATCSLVPQHPRLFEAINRETVLRVQDFSAQNLANVARSFAAAGIAPPLLFETIANEVKISDLNPQARASIARAFATAGFASPRLFGAVANETLIRTPVVENMNSQDMANTAWAFASVNWDRSADLFLELESALALQIDSLEDVALTQMYLATLHARSLWPDLNLPLQAHLERLRAAYLRTKPNPSQFQRDVSTLLKDHIGWTHELEHITIEGFSLDLADPTTKRAIEVDGPSHFLRETSHGDLLIFNGGTRLKKRLLRTSGWHLATVSFLEWEHAETHADRKQLLTNKLQSIGEVITQITS